MGFVPTPQRIPAASAPAGSCSGDPPADRRWPSCSAPAPPAVAASPDTIHRHAGAALRSSSVVLRLVFRGARVPATTNGAWPSVLLCRRASWSRSSLWWAHLLRRSRINFVAHTVIYFMSLFLFFLGQLFYSLLRIARS